MNPHNHLLELVGASSPIKMVEHLIRHVAKTSTTVLILGESGTGKELVAHIAHNLSDRAEGPFIPVNCAAIPLELLESELFGHEKGSFTGAYLSRQGRFELAAGGTLFLDEIGDMPLSMQAKLLRVLQEKSFERVGSNKSIKADVRIIAATHKNLEDSMSDGEFREDLYYRLNVFPIEIPPLRDRLEDIPLLIDYFIKKYQAESNNTVEFEMETLHFLEQYEWPGNVRELSNLIERLIILHPGKKITVQDLPEAFLRTAAKRLDKNLTVLTSPELNSKKRFDLKEHLAQLEFSLISQALQDCNGIVARAAKLLGLRRTTLVEKMKKYGMGREVNYKIQNELG
jgi:sigma-54 specific flagellar transcriptional regulator A